MDSSQLGPDSVLEEVLEWKARCLKAEGEVRALKRGRHADPGAWSNETPQPSPRSNTNSQNEDGRCKNQTQTAQDLVAKLETELRSVQQEKDAVEARLEESQSGHTQRFTSDVEELREELKRKSDAMIELESSMVKDMQHIDRQRKDTQSVNLLCHEELQQMTLRAKALSEQVNVQNKQSRKKSSELQHARDEVTTLSANLKDCELNLSSLQAANAALLQEKERLRSELSDSISNLDSAREIEQQKVNKRLACLGDEVTMAHQQHTAVLKQLEATQAEKALLLQSSKKVIGGAVHSELQRNTRSLRALCDQLRGELQVLDESVLKKLNFGDTGAKSSTAACEKIVMYMAKQLEELQHVTDGLESGDEETILRTSSPEGEHPPPEDGQASQCERPEATHKRDEIADEHCAEIDDLLKEHDLERRRLHQEIMELRCECNQYKVANDIAMQKPISELRTHFESEVAAMKRELVKQFADFREREQEQRAEHKHAYDAVQRDFEKCQRELASSQEEFKILSLLFDKTRRENAEFKHCQRAWESQLEHERTQKTLQADSSTGNLVPAGAVSLGPMSPDSSTSSESRMLSADKSGAFPIERTNSVTSLSPSLEEKYERHHARGESTCSYVFEEHLRHDPLIVSSPAALGRLSIGSASLASDLLSPRSAFEAPLVRTAPVNPTFTPRGSRPTISVDESPAAEPTPFQAPGASAFGSAVIALTALDHSSSTSPASCASLSQGQPPATKLATPRQRAGLARKASSAAATTPSPSAALGVAGSKCVPLLPTGSGLRMPGHASQPYGPVLEERRAIA